MHHKKGENIYSEIWNHDKNYTFRGRDRLPSSRRIGSETPTHLDQIPHKHVISGFRRCSIFVSAPLGVYATSFWLLTNVSGRLVEGTIRVQMFHSEHPDAESDKPSRNVGWQLKNDAAEKPKWDDTTIAQMFLTSGMRHHQTLFT
jgi:hypothetical protein